MVADTSNGYWEEGKVPDAMLRNTNKAKTQQLWHKGKAYLWKMPYMRGGPVATDNLCPLCNQPDSGSHILGGCAHPEMKKMVIYRHDEAHRIIINAVNKGKKGSCLIIADVGTAATLGNLGVHHKRIPKWVLPNSMLALHSADPDEMRTKLRPDIMMVELQEHEQSIYQRAASTTNHRVLPSSVIDSWLGCGRQRKIWIVEGGYCADTRYVEKMAEKNEQHEKLVDMLKMYGYDVHLRPMPLGYAGTIYNCNLSMLQDLGLQRTVAKGVLKKLHMHAITSLHNMIKERRYLQNNGRYALQARGNRRDSGAGSS